MGVPGILVKASAVGRFVANLEMNIFFIIYLFKCFGVYAQWQGPKTKSEAAVTIPPAEGAAEAGAVCEHDELEKGITVGCSRRTRGKRTEK